MKHKKYLFFCIFFFSKLCGYGVPPLNLGGSNILDGGPLRPKAGFYWLQYLTYYTTNKFLDANGNCLGNIPSPHFDYLATAFQFIYFADKKLVANGNWGVAAAIPVVLSTKITANSLGITNSGAGIGNLILGGFLQWDPIKIKERPIFVHRFEIDIAFPSGKNEEPFFLINPATNFFYFNVYWAATLYFTPQWAISWRLNYLWCNPNKRTNIKTGDTFYMSYSMEYNVAPNVFAAINGYFLQQLKNNSFCGIEMANGRERVLGIGPGIAAFLPKNFILLGHFYGELLARNRTQGLRAVLRLIKRF